MGFAAMQVGMYHLPSLLRNVTINPLIMVEGQITLYNPDFKSLIVKCIYSFMALKPLASISLAL
jgi:hypothetical protein